MTVATEKKTRQEEIIERFKILSDVYDDFDPSETGNMIDRELEAAIDDAINSLQAGDVPAKCQGLFLQTFQNLVPEWMAYQGGDKIHKDGSPHATLYRAIENSVSMINAIEYAPERKLESVALLRKQGLDYRQIAVIYGERIPYRNGQYIYNGPFFNDNGAPIISLIEQEAENPGSVIGKDWVHPAEQRRLKEIEELSKSRLAEYRSKKEDANSKEDPHALLLEGQFPNVVAKVCGLPINTVLDMARKLKAPNAEYDAATAVSDDDYKPSISNEELAEQALKLPPEPTDAPVDEPVDKAAPKSGPGMKPRGRKRVNELAKAKILEVSEAHPEFGAPEIAREMRDEHSIPVSVTSISMVLHHHRKKKEKQEREERLRNGD